MQLFLHDSSRNGTLSSTPLYSSCLFAATHGANMGYMELESCFPSVRIAVPLSGRLGLGWREEGYGEEDWGELNVPARCLTEGRSAGPSTFESVSSRRCRRTCQRSHHFDSLCGGHLLFAYVCLTCVFGVFTGVLNTITCVPV